MTILATLLLSFLVVFVAIAAMAAGVLAGRRPIAGSCGGISGRPCALCGAGSGNRAGNPTGDSHSAGDPQ